MGKTCKRKIFFSHHLLVWVDPGLSLSTSMYACMQAQLTCLCSDSAQGEEGRIMYIYYCSLMHLMS